MNVVPVLISAIRLPPRRDVEDEPALVDQKALQDIEVLLATDKRSATNDFPDSLSQNCLALKVVPTTHCHDGHEQKRFGLLEIIGRHFCRNDHKGEMLTHVFAESIENKQLFMLIVEDLIDMVWRRQNSGI